MKTGKKEAFRNGLFLGCRCSASSTGRDVFGERRKEGSHGLSCCSSHSASLNDIAGFSHIRTLPAKISIILIIFCWRTISMEEEEEGMACWTLACWLKPTGSCTSKTEPSGPKSSIFALVTPHFFDSKVVISQF